MIFDSKLKLVDNQSIGTQTFLGAWISSNKLSISSLRSIGKGEPTYCAVTVKSAFTDANVNVAFSLVSEFDAFSKENIESLPTATDKILFTVYRMPRAGFSGYISCASSTGNFVAGKSYVFPINPFTAKQNAVGAVHSGNKNLYFAATFFDPATGIPSAAVTDGNIDVDIVTMATPGAGASFCDLEYYPTSVKVV